MALAAHAQPLTALVYCYGAVGRVVLHPGPVVKDWPRDPDDGFHYVPRYSITFMKFEKDGVHFATTSDGFRIDGNEVIVESIQKYSGTMSPVHISQDAQASIFCTSGVIKYFKNYDELSKLLNLPR